LAPIAKGAAPKALERSIGRHLRHSRARYGTRKHCQNLSAADNNRFFNKLLEVFATAREAICD
jgi:hypothetical protein